MSKRIWATAVFVVASVTVAAAVGRHSEAGAIPAANPVVAGGPEQPQVIETGTTNGTRWVLSAYPSARGFCFDLKFPGASAGGCGYGVPAKYALGYDSTRMAGSTWIYGPVLSTISTVEITLLDGEVVTVAPINAPPQLKASWNVYLLQVPEIVEVRSVAGRDATGELVGRAVIRHAEAMNGEASGLSRKAADGRRRARNSRLSSSPLPVVRPVG